MTAKCTLVIALASIAFFIAMLPKLTPDGLRPLIYAAVTERK